MMLFSFIFPQSLPNITLKINDNLVGESDKIDDYEFSLFDPPSQKIRSNNNESNTHIFQEINHQERSRSNNRFNAGLSTASFRSDHIVLPRTIFQGHNKNRQNGFDSLLQIVNRAPQVQRFHYMDSKYRQPQGSAFVVQDYKDVSTSNDQNQNDELQQSSVHTADQNQVNFDSNTANAQFQHGSNVRIDQQYQPQLYSKTSEELKAQNQQSSLSLLDGNTNIRADKSPFSIKLPFSQNPVETQKYGYFSYVQPFGHNLSHFEQNNTLVANNDQSQFPFDQSQFYPQLYGTEKYHDSIQYEQQPVKYNTAVYKQLSPDDAGQSEGPNNYKPQLVFNRTEDFPLISLLPANHPKVFLSQELDKQNAPDAVNGNHNQINGFADIYQSSLSIAAPQDQNQLQNKIEDVQIYNNYSLTSDQNKLQSGSGSSNNLLLSSGYPETTSLAVKDQTEQIAISHNYKPVKDSPSLSEENNQQKIEGGDYGQVHVTNDLLAGQDQKHKNTQIIITLHNNPRIQVYYVLISISYINIFLEE